MGADRCPFCQVDPARVFHRGRSVLGLWDAYPVSPGHALLVPYRHVADWFEATEAERAELTAAVDVAKAAILARHRLPDGFNLGVNVGAAAGQTVPHLHLHVIPRYAGDVPDPRGGVRFVVPHKANYLRGGGIANPLLPGLPHELSLVRGEDDPLLPHLLAHLDASCGADIAVAFVLRSGVRLLFEHLRDLLDRGGRLRLLAGDYLDVTEPEALLQLLDLEASTAPAHPPQLRVFETGGGSSFHPKAYVFYHADGSGTAYVGSSNLTATALGGGVEWNYRAISSRDAAGFADVVGGFERLFTHPATRTLNAGWVESYRRRRTPRVSSTAAIQAAAVEVPAEAPPTPPQPHGVQQEALAALGRTRAAGNTAGLVVLATGLGKTWLSAFDSARPEYRRVLFVAHREEILAQALATFRRIRPDARLGKYTGNEKATDADVLFASVQTLGRQRHLDQFAPDDFDYVVVDEFHHAAAATYRRLIEHFRPKFLLGLTATPERSDGGDLLGLCQENLVYRCDLADGIRRGLLSPFHYFGVPDDIDYRNIPWRSSRFDEEALTQAWATRERAANALEQYRRRAGRRTLAFCCSQRHADFMAGFLRDQGVRAVAVHAGEASAPRAASLEQLEAGALDVVCAVDMFNEGVDLPLVDTVMMLRPTESRVLWLQQFGRGLRKSDDKPHLTVVDYIGNHRSFLLKPRTLLELGPGDRDVNLALQRVVAGEWALPPGCEVTYDLEAVDILRGLLRVGRFDGPELVRAYYEDFRERNGVRPRAAEVHHEGYNPRTMRKAHGSWLRFVAAMGDLGPDESAVLQDRLAGGFLDALEVTPLSKSFKLLTLQALLEADRFPGRATIEELTDGFARAARRSAAAIKAEVAPALDDPQALRRLLEHNPIDAWAGGRGTEGGPYFTYAGGVFSSAFAVPASARAQFQDLVRELVEWRLAEYLRRSPDEAAEAGEAGEMTFVGKVKRTGENTPMVFLPDRARHPQVPEGWTPLLADERQLEANFVKVALNVVRRGADEPANVLQDVLRGWFGPDAGRPGTDHQVRFRRLADATGWAMEPLPHAGQDQRDANAPQLWRHYMREQIPPLFGLTFNRAVWNVGFVKQPGHLFLLVTLEKGDLHTDFRYADRFLSPELFQWQSQNRTRRDSTHGHDISRHRERGLRVHLFVRRRKTIDGKGAPFIYCGEVEFVDWENDTPITVRWHLGQAVPPALRQSLGVLEDTP